MFGYPGEIRRAVYTTNTIESLNMTLRKITKNRSLFPNDEAVFKLMYLGLRNISKRWTMPIRDWSRAMNQFAILFEGRVPMVGMLLDIESALLARSVIPTVKELVRGAALSTGSTPECSQESFVNHLLYILGCSFYTIRDTFFQFCSYPMNPNSKRINRDSELYC